MIEEYINKRYSLRNITDDKFEEIIKTLAEELEHYDYSIKYDTTLLNKDWKDLTLFSSNLNSINSTTRIGMKLLEHFNQNIWLVCNGDNSFSSCWNKDTLEKVLRWNRKSHSTPYISELRRGVYFCTGLNKVTMYRPTLAKIVCDYYKPDTVFDPCAGWGGRMLGAVASGSKYIGVEPNIDTYNNLLALATFLNINNKVTLINDSAENYLSLKHQLVLTSPPYFDLELYGGVNQSVDIYSHYDDWSNNFLDKIIKSATINNVVSCWNVANFGGHDLVGDVSKYHINQGYTKTNEFYVNSSKRPTGGAGRKNDITYCFGRI
jgi:hypothetical protein